MVVVQSLRLGAGFTASRVSRSTIFAAPRDCYGPITRQLSTSSLANKQLLPSAQLPHLCGSAHSRLSIRSQKEKDQKPSTQQARCISLEAPREPLAGSEPGININDDKAWPQWRKTVQSQITAVDFSKDRIQKYELDNSSLEDFLAKPREDWVTCRWINGM